VAERDELRAPATGEVVEVDAAIHLAVGSSDGGAHRVNAIDAIGVRLHDLPGEADEFHVIRRQVPAWNVHAHHFRTGATLGPRSCRQARSSGRAPRLSTGKVSGGLASHRR
jgi:hypothetical protein